MRYLAILILPLLVSCSENYRYPCQDPDNWDKQICQKPWCSANGTCPENLKHYEKDKEGQVIIPQTSLQNQASSKGDCK
jgi:hypothetical protein